MRYCPISMEYVTHDKKPGNAEYYLIISEFTVNEAVHLNHQSVEHVPGIVVSRLCLISLSL